MPHLCIIFYMLGCLLVAPSHVLSAQCKNSFATCILLTGLLTIFQFVCIFRHVCSWYYGCLKIMTIISFNKRHRLARITFLLFPLQSKKSCFKKKVNNDFLMNYANVLGSHWVPFIAAVSLSMYFTCPHINFPCR